MKVILDFKPGQYVRFVEALRAYAVAEQNYISTDVDDEKEFDAVDNDLKIAAADVLDAMWDAIPAHVIDEMERGDLF